MPTFTIYMVEPLRNFIMLLLAYRMIALIISFIK